MLYQMHLNAILANGLSLIPSLLMLQALVERLAINLMFQNLCKHFAHKLSFNSSTSMVWLSYPRMNA